MVAGPDLQQARNKFRYHAAAENFCGENESDRRLQRCGRPFFMIQIDRERQNLFSVPLTISLFWHLSLKGEKKNAA